MRLSGAMTDKSNGNSHHEEDAFRVEGQPEFVSNAMMATASLLELSDRDRLQVEMLRTGEMSNPWFKDWFDTLEDIPESERFSLLEEAMYLTQRFGDSITSFNERQALRYEHRIPYQRKAEEDKVIMRQKNQQELEEVSTDQGWLRWLRLSDSLISSLAPWVTVIFIAALVVKYILIG